MEWKLRSPIKRRRPAAAASPVVAAVQVGAGALALLAAAALLMALLLHPREAELRVVDVEVTMGESTTTGIEIGPAR